jgi:hypothetical protein
MVFIGHCPPSHDINAVNYSPTTGVDIHNDPGVPITVSQSNGPVAIDDAHPYDHCVGISLGALIGIIIGLIIAGVVAWLVWRLVKKRRAAKSGEGQNGGGSVPVMGTWGAMGGRDEEKGGVGRL